MPVSNKGEDNRMQDIVNHPRRQETGRVVAFVLSDTPRTRALARLLWRIRQRQLQKEAA